MKVSPRIPPALYVALLGAAAGAAALGFVREAVIAALFGASRQTDAYYAALSVPFVAAQFLVGGAIAPPLTSAMAQLLERGDRAAGRATLSAAFAWILAAGLAMAALTAFFQEGLARRLVPGFESADQLLTGRLLLSLWAYGILTALSLAGAAALIAAESYVVPAVSFLAGNLASLATLVLTRESGIVAAAWAANGGAAVQLIVVLSGLARAGLLPARFGTGARAFPLRQSGFLVASLLAAGAVDLLERRFASGAAVGSLALLAFGSKLVHLPMRLLAAPLASVAFPRLVRGTTRRDRDAPREAGETANRVFLLLAWSAAVTSAAAGPIASLTFGRGRFDAASVAALAEVLRVLAPAAIAIGLLEVLSKYLLAAGRARAVAGAQVLGLVVYFGAAPVLAPGGAPGLAAARTLAWCVVAVSLALPLVLGQRELGLLRGAPVVLLGTVLAALASSLLLPLAPDLRPVQVAAAAAVSGAILLMVVGLSRRGAAFAPRT